MRTREAGYKDYGFTKAESEEWLKKCQNADSSMEQVILCAAQESNESISAELFFSLKTGASYEYLCCTHEIPIGLSDFYAYKRRALYLVKEKMQENDHVIQKEYQEAGIMRRFCNVETVSEELQISQYMAKKIANEAGAIMKIGGFIRIDMTALYAYIDSECKIDVVQV